MNGRTHLIAGICVGAITCTFLKEPNFSNVSLIVMGSSFGSLVPDIDEPNSRIGRKVQLLSSATKSIFGHRGLTHTPFIVMLLLILFNFLYMKYSLDLGFMAFYSAFILGYISHLLLDFITPRGIMLAFPFSVKKFHFIGLKSRYKDIICSLLIILLTASIMLYKYNIFDIENYIVNYVKNTLK